MLRVPSSIPPYKPQKPPLPACCNWELLNANRIRIHPLRKTDFLCIKQHGWKITHIEALLVVFYSEIKLTKVLDMATRSSQIKRIEWAVPSGQ